MDSQVYKSGYLFSPRNFRHTEKLERLVWVYLPFILGEGTFMNPLSLGGAKGICRTLNTYRLKLSMNRSMDELRCVSMEVRCRDSNKWYHNIQGPATWAGTNVNASYVTSREGESPCSGMPYEMSMQNAHTICRVLKTRIFPRTYLYAPIGQGKAFSERLDVCVSVA